MQTVKVRLRKPNRVFTFLSNNIPVERSDSCIVRSDRGLEYGTCVLSPEPCSEQDRERYKMTVIRKATAHDERTFEQIQGDEKRAATVFLEKIRARKLPMKLAEVEYTFDRRKATFYFTAEDRVDFRQLVRDLAQTLKARIELRHIQVRDEAKMVGGIGTCGRELCCTSWLREFFPISMKMAKRQNLSLNPSKISGQCGRLMCCLAYENDQYDKTKKRPPPKTAPDDTTVIQIRDTMEANAPEAAEVLKTASSSDVPPPVGPEPERETVPSRTKPSRSRQRRGGRGQERKKSTQQKAGGGPSSGGTQENRDATAQPKRPKGKRRRRRGKRQGDGSGAQGAAQKKTGSS